MTIRRLRALGRTGPYVVALLALGGAACLGADGDWGPERSSAAVGDSCSAPDGGVASDGGTASPSAAPGPRDGGAIADAGTARDGGSPKDGGTDGGIDGGPDGGCSCPAGEAWDGTPETIV